MHKLGSANSGWLQVMWAVKLMARDLISVEESRFVSECGDAWKLSYNRETDRATLTGSDIGEVTYPVIEGVGYGISLRPDEKEWLRTAWVAMCAGSPSASLYLGMNTELVQGAQSCWLTNDYCPICLMQKVEFEIHHCIAASDGGSDSPSNLLSICKSCHALITNGGVEHRFPKGKAALMHQRMIFGFKTFLDSLDRPSKRSKNRINERFPVVIEFAERIRGLSPSEFESQNERFKSECRHEYQFARDVGMGRWSWQKHKRMMGFKSDLSEDVE